MDALGAAQVVILAAGEGTRLAGLEHDGPKPTAPVAGRSLAERCLRAFADAGLRNFIVITGADGDRVGAHYRALAARLAVELRTVAAADWKHGNGASARAASAAVGDRPFLLTMSDHLFAPDLIAAVCAFRSERDEIALAVDRTRDVLDPDDLTRVRLRAGRVVAIGKDLEPWDAGDTGLFYATQKLFEGLDEARAAGAHSLSDGVRCCIARGGVAAIDVTGHPWIDVDTPAAHAEAERLINKGELTA